MNRYARYTALALAALLAGGTLARAETWYHRAYHSMKRDFHRNNVWPHPFMYPDRDAGRAPFAIMVHNGWRLQNTLGSYHFHQETGQLTEAGQLKVEWILTQAPPQFRTIFVERGTTHEDTLARTKSIQELSANYLPPGAVAQVIPSLIPPRGASAAQIDATNRQYYSTIPAPRLPAASASSGGSGGN